VAKERKQNEESRDGIFLNYRREDTDFPAQNLYAKLVKRFGRDRVFKDLDSIGITEDFWKSIEEGIGRSGVMLTLIGSNWCNAENRARLADPDDFVRREIETAYRLGVTVIPIWIAGGETPSDTDLPESLQRLNLANAHNLGNARDFDREADRLIGKLARKMELDQGAQRESTRRESTKQPMTSKKQAEDHRRLEHLRGSVPRPTRRVDEPPEDDFYDEYEEEDSPGVLMALMIVLILGVLAIFVAIGILVGSKAGALDKLFAVEAEPNSVVSDKVELRAESFAEGKPEPMVSEPTPVRAAEAAAGSEMGVNSGQFRRPSAVDSAGPIILGAFDKSVIDRVVKKKLAQIRYCYQKGLNKNPGLWGEVVVSFRIDNDGGVSSVKTKSTTLEYPSHETASPVETCINRRISKLKFPEPSDGGVVLVSYPFRFSTAPP